jgi:hypothetical protein
MNRRECNFNDEHTCALRVLGGKPVMGSRPVWLLLMVEPSRRVTVTMVEYDI